MKPLKRTSFTFRRNSRDIYSYKISLPFQDYPSFQPKVKLKSSRRNSSFSRIGENNSIDIDIPARRSTGPRVSRRRKMKKKISITTRGSSVKLPRPITNIGDRGGKNKNSNRGGSIKIRRHSYSVASGKEGKWSGSRNSMFITVPTHPLFSGKERGMGNNRVSIASLVEDDCKIFYARIAKMENVETVCKEMVDYFARIGSSEFNSNSKNQQQCVPDLFLVTRKIEKVLTSVSVSLNLIHKNVVKRIKSKACLSEREVQELIDRFKRENRIMKYKGVFLDSFGNLIPIKGIPLTSEMKKIDVFFKPTKNEVKKKTKGMNNDEEKKIIIFVQFEKKCIKLDISKKKSRNFFTEKFLENVFKKFGINITEDERKENYNFYIKGEKEKLFKLLRFSNNSNENGNHERSLFSNSSNKKIQEIIKKSEKVKILIKFINRRKLSKMEILYSNFKSLNNKTISNLDINSNNLESFFKNLQNRDNKGNQDGGEVNGINIFRNKKIKIFSYNLSPNNSKVFQFLVIVKKNNYPILFKKMNLNLVLQMVRKRIEKILLKKFVTSFSKREKENANESENVEKLQLLSENEESHVHVYDFNNKKQLIQIKIQNRENEQKEESIEMNDNKNEEKDSRDNNDEITSIFKNLLLDTNKKKSQEICNNNEKESERRDEIFKGTFIDILKNFLFVLINNILVNVKVSKVEIYLNDKQNNSFELNYIHKLVNTYEKELIFKKNVYNGLIYGNESYVTGSKKTKNELLKLKLKNNFGGSGGYLCKKIEFLKDNKGIVKSDDLIVRVRKFSSDNSKIREKIFKEKNGFDYFKKKVKSSNIGDRIEILVKLPNFKVKFVIHGKNLKLKNRNIGLIEEKVAKIFEEVQKFSLAFVKKNFPKEIEKIIEKMDRLNKLPRENYEIPIKDFLLFCENNPFQVLCFGPKERKKKLKTKIFKNLKNLLIINIKKTPKSQIKNLKSKVFLDLVSKFCKLSPWYWSKMTSAQCKKYLVECLVKFKKNSIRSLKSEEFLQSLKRQVILTKNEWKQQFIRFIKFCSEF